MTYAHDATCNTFHRAGQGPCPPPDNTPTDPHTIRQWLPVRERDGRASTLYVRDVRTAHTPRNGDTVHLWDDTGDTGGARWLVKDTYWTATGLYNIELAALVVDPDADQIDRMRRAGPMLYAGMPWYPVGGDGQRLDHDRLLTDAGWTEWDGS